MILFFILVILLNLISSLNFSFNDLTLFKYSLISLVLLVASSQLANFYDRIYGAQSQDKFFDHIMFFAAFNSSIGLISILNNDFAHVFHEFFLQSENAQQHLSQGYRATGFFYSGASTLSVFYSLAFFLGWIQLSNKNKTFASKVIVILNMLLIALGLVTSGRLGLMIAFITPIILMFIPLRSHILDKKRMFFVNLFFLVCAVVSVVLLWDEFEAILKWAFEIFYNYFETGEVHSNSSSYLFSNMYFLPDDILLGEGSFGRSSNVEYIDTDVGFILLLFSGGIVSLLVYISIYLYFALKAISYNNSKVSLFLMYSLIVTFLCNFKDAYLFINSGVTQIIFIAFFILNSVSSNTRLHHDKEV